MIKEDLIADLDYLESCLDEARNAILKVIELADSKGLIQEDREWVGLTDEDIEEVISFPWHYIPFARAVEAKLKEKNT